MRQMIVVLAVGVFMFAASAGVSWYLRGVEAAKSADLNASEEKGHGAGKAHISTEFGAKGPGSKALGGLDTQSSASTRTSPPSADSVAQLASSLRQQQETLKTREHGFAVRQKHLEVIHGDLRNERKSVDDLRTQVNEEMKALTEKLAVMERKAQELEKKKQEMGKQADEVKQTLIEVDSAEQKNFKKMAVTFDSMDAGTAAELLQQMADGGKIDMAVKILSTMQERQAARVLGQMEDRGAAVQMLDKMKGLKRPTATP